MSWAHVQGTSAAPSSGGVTTLSCAFASAVTAGDLIVVGLVAEGGSGLVIKDNVNNTNYTQCIHTTSSSHGVSFCDIYMFVAPLGGTGFTVTATWSGGSHPAMSIDEFSFTPGYTIALDTSGSNNYGGTASSSLSIPTLTITKNDLVYCIAIFDNGTFTGGGSPTGLVTPVAGSGGVNYALGGEYWCNQTTNISPTATISPSGEWAFLAAAISAAAPPTGFTVSPSTIPASHSGSMLLTLTGTGTSWTSGSTVSVQNSVTGTTTVTKGTWTQTSGTAATLAVTTGAGAGTFTITIDGIVSPSLTVGTASFTISPATGNIGGAPTITATGTNTVWSLDGATGLFTLSGGTGASISSISVSSNTSATFTLTTGSAATTLTITDAPTGDTATFTATNAFTTSQAGYWDLASTWGGSGPPGSGATATISYAVTVRYNTTVGISPSTGGTAAITLVNGGSLSITGIGTTLTLQGSLFGSSSSGSTPVTLAAGTNLLFVVPAGQSYVYVSTGSGGSFPITCNGTSANHCTVSASLGTGATCYYGTIYPSQVCGFITCTYTDFSNLYSTIADYWGVFTGNAASSSTQNHTFTNCTFTNSNFLLWMTLTTNPWAGNLTFQYCTFTSSHANTDVGFSACAEFALYEYPTGQTRLIDTNSFDLGCAVTYLPQCTVTNNYFGGGLGYNGTWPNSSYLSGNFIPTMTYLGLTLGGSCANNYIISNYVNGYSIFLWLPAAGNITVDSCVFESINSSNTGTGLIVYQPVASSARTITVQRCIAIPNSGTNISPGSIGATGDSGNTTWNVLHNTLYAGSQAAIMEGWGGEGTAGQFAAVEANLIWNSTQAAGKSYKWLDSPKPISGGTSNVVSPTNANYNSSWNCYTNEPSTYSGNTYTYAGNGYQGNFTAYCGANDMADQNPSFVQSTRNLAAWGGTAAGGGTATVAGAMAAMAANPALINQAVTGLLPWVRAGFRPQASAFEATGWSGDTSTADANGNAWPGSTPGFGAMAWQSLATSASGTITLGAVTAAGSGGFVSPASGIVSLGHLVISGAGGFVSPASGAITLGSLSPAGSGGFTITASGSVALAALTVSGSATASIPGIASGSGAITLGVLAITGVGSFATTAGGSVTLAALTVSGAGTFAGIGGSTGSGTVTLAGLAAAGAGGFGTTGHGTITLGSIIVTSAANGGGVGPLYLPYEFTSVLITTENEILDDPFGIDAELTTLITSGLTPSD